MTRTIDKYMDPATSKRKPLKVRASVTVEVDLDAYEAEYGYRPTAEEVRDMVRSTLVTAASDDGVVFPMGSGIIVGVK